MPAEKLFHEQVSTDPKLRWKSYPKIIEELKVKAKKQGLWMLWANKVQYPEMTAGLTNLEYAVMAEIMGHAIRIAPEATNSSAPDTGNMGTCRPYSGRLTLASAGFRTLFLTFFSPPRRTNLPRSLFLRRFTRACRGSRSLR